MSGLGSNLAGTALLTASVAMASAALPGGGPSGLPKAPGASAAYDRIADQAQALSEANAALQAGEADKALALLAPLPQGGDPEGHNLICRVRFALDQFDAAAAECEQATRLDPQNSDYHLWLGRALGEKADRASFLSAFSLAKRARAEFEESVRLNPRNAEALSDLGEFYRQAPAVVGGGVDKAEDVASRLDKVEPSRAHLLRGHIAEQHKDYAGAEREFKEAVAANPHPALDWTTLASFYSRRQRYDDMDAAVHSVLSTGLHDKHAAVALYDGAGVLTAAGRDLALAATLLEDYLASSAKTEEAPAFVAHLRLARVKAQLGDTAAADRERAAALALAHEYKPAQDFKPQVGSRQQAAVVPQTQQQADNRQSLQ